MNQFIFTPDMPSEMEIEPPFIEDARSAFAPYYTSADTTSLRDAESQVAIELGKLGGYITAFHQGKFGMNDDGVERYGYEIKFTFKGAPGIIRVAGLPIRKETEKKIKQVRVQALLNVRDWLKVAVTMKVFAPGTSPLLPHLLLPGGNGKITIADYIMSHGNLPELAPPKSERITIEETSP
jgi:hypothetical protein